MSATSCAVRPSCAALIISEPGKRRRAADAVAGNDLRDAAHAAHHQRIAFLDQHALDRQAVLGPISVPS